MRVLPVKVTLLSFLCCCLLLTACTTVERSGDRFSSEKGWSSSDPLSIPYDTRQAQLATGNLVINPFFENGRQDDEKNIILYPKAGKWSATMLNGLSNERNDDAQEVNTGSRSVKIARAPRPMKGMTPKGLSVIFCR